MRVGQPAHAIKFIAKVREEDRQAAVSALRDPVLPVLRASGFREVFVCARHLRLEKLDPDAPGIAGSPVLRRLVREARPHEAGREQILEKLRSRPGGHVPSGFAHALRLHHKKKRDPSAYARLRESRLAQDRELGERVLAEENLLRIAGYQLECYALYGSETDMRDDTLDLEARRKEVPFSGEFIGREQGALLFVGLSGIHHTVVHRIIPEGILGETSAQAASRRVFVSQSRFSVLPALLREAESRLRDSLLPRLAASEGAAGALALQSRGDGFSGGLRWAPATLSEHGGGPPGKRLAELPRDPSDAPIPHEILSFWRTEADLLAGERWLADNLPDALADVALARGRTVDLRAESGELVLHA